MSGDRIAPQAPSGPELTDYDRRRLVTYLRLLDSEAAGASWEEVARVLLEADPVAAREAARRRYDSHLRRARWMAERGYLALLRTGRA
jgi:hypothetical protein